MDDDVRVGLVDGSVPATTRRFSVVLEDDAVVQLDDLLLCSQPLRDGRTVTHYGIVVEGTGDIEGAELRSDTERIAGSQTMPGRVSRAVTVQMLRTFEEVWIPPQPGAAIYRASGPQRDMALFADQMSHPIPIGLDINEQPILLDFSFLSGEKGGHASISGISGVATKTSFALFMLYMLLETTHGDAVLRPHKPNTRALVFNVKGEDLLHLDRPNGAFDAAKHAARWTALGVTSPGPFGDVEFFVPRAARAHSGARVADVESRQQEDVTVYGWTPDAFIRGGLLRFCFSDAADTRNQLSFLEQKVRTQLLRWMHPARLADGSIVMREPEPDFPQTFERALLRKRLPVDPGSGTLISDFGDLVEFIADKIGGQYSDPHWVGIAAPGTVLAFLRRLYAMVPRLGPLVCTNVASIEQRSRISVVDIHALHDDAQRFVVGALLSQIFEAKQGSGREPLQFVVLDELNKYAPRDGSSPIKEVLVDIAARGRSLGIILIGAQQSASDVDRAVTTNSAIKVVGRLDASTADEYRFLSAELRERAARFLPGTMVLDQPIVPAPIPLRFPFPCYATNVAEGRQPDPEARVAAAFASLS